MKSFNEFTLIPGTAAYAKKMCERMEATAGFMEAARLALREAESGEWVTDEELMGVWPAAYPGRPPERTPIR